MNRLLMLAPAFLAACTTAVVEERARPESDERPLATFHVDGVDVQGRAALTLEDGRVLIIDARDALRFASSKRPLLDGVRAVADLRDGRVVASRSTDVGESDLWLVPLQPRDGPPRALAAEKGADEMPLVLDDGRVLFVSTRSSVASLWIVAPDGTSLRQLTNADARPGALGAAFVPSPVEYVASEGARVTYDAGDGALVTIDVDTGSVTKGGAR